MIRGMTWRRGRRVPASRGGRRDTRFVALGTVTYRGREREVIGLSYGPPGPLTRRRARLTASSFASPCLVLDDGVAVAASDPHIRATDHSTAWVVAKAPGAPYTLADGSGAGEWLEVPHTVTVVVRYLADGPRELIIARWQDGNEIRVGVFAGADLTIDRKTGLTAGCLRRKHPIEHLGTGNSRVLWWWERDVRWGRCANCGARERTITWSRRPRQRRRS